ncbi:MAG: amidohydrolase family protein, partial [Dehalococcoidia bacterium]|nr:amidohydrolase family protein [Dehalococcoidia bacterium]
MSDLLIKNGLVIDGSGSVGFYAAVLITGDAVTIHRGDVSHLEAERVIDATGYVVCPGFVDVHSHAGLTILGAPHHDPKVRQGVTTELVGIDGISHAPFKSQEELHRYIWLDSGLTGYPPMPADCGMPPPMEVAGDVVMAPPPGDAAGAPPPPQGP